MKFDVLAMAIATGLFWGGIVGGIDRWAGRKASGSQNEKAARLTSDVMFR